MLNKHYSELLPQPEPQKLPPLFSFTRLDTSNYSVIFLTQIESLCAVYFLPESRGRAGGPAEARKRYLSQCNGTHPIQGP